MSYREWAVYTKNYKAFDAENDFLTEYKMIINIRVLKLRSENKTNGTRHDIL